MGSVSKIHVVTNPAAGARQSKTVLADEVIPLLPSDRPVQHWETTGARDGERIGAAIRDETGENGTADVVLLGGDGTTHEVLNGFFSSPTSARIQVALVPTGTANALHAAMYPGQGRLDSLRALVGAKQGHLFPLTLTLNTTTDTHAKEHTRLTHLITSHALHAAILHDSDAVRAEHPGIERFKLAAQMNATNWIGGSLRLLAEGQQVKRFNPQSKSFEPHPSELDGPFLYLAALTTDRLEPAFVPAPFSSAFPSEATDENLQRPPDAIDIVVVRPTRDPQVNDQELETRIQFATTRLTEITQDMYSAGKHVGLTYDRPDEPVVEYFRASGYEFTPVSCHSRPCVRIQRGDPLTKPFHLRTWTNRKPY